MYRGTGEKERALGIYRPCLFLPSCAAWLVAFFLSFSLPLLAGWLAVRSKLRAGSQKLPVLEESARSWIILPKGIFIGRECMQKRGHRHKGAAPADLALTQLAEPRTLADSTLAAVLSTGQRELSLSLSPSFSLSLSLSAIPG